MPAVLTHKAIMLMARERLADMTGTVTRAIARKKAAGLPVRDLEHKLLALAVETYRQMSSPPPIDATVPGQLFARPAKDQVSKFAVMGAMGPDITGFSALFAPGQGWVFDTVHKGTPDADREALRAGTSDLALEIWAEASAHTAPAQHDKIRAYVLGHVCHIAGDVISHPFINDLEWHAGTDQREKLEHADGEGSHDAMVARSVFARGGTREGQSWGKWWPTVDDVPDELFAAYEQALENVYGARTSRPRGFGGFERTMAELDAPGLDGDFVRDGYKVYRDGIISIGYGYGLWQWFGILAPIWLPAVAMPLLIHALPTGRQLFVNPTPPSAADSERKWFEVLSLPVLIGAADALIYGGWIASLTSRGVKRRTVAGLLASAIGVVGLIVFIIEAFARGMPEAARWPLLFALPLGIAVTFLIFGLADIGTEHKGKRAAASIVHSFPLIQFVLLMIGLFFVFNPMAGEQRLDDPFFWVALVFWLLWCGVLWIGIALTARDAKIPEDPDDFAARRRHAVRLFDDSSIFSDPVRRALGKPDRFFPSGRRPIMKLWWEGGGEMSVRSDRYGLVFKLTDGTTTEQTVPAPVAPMKPTEYLGFLAAVVTDRNGATGKLKGAMMFPDAEEDYELPAGATFAAHGDEEKKEADRRQKSAEFKKLGSNSDSDYVLYHAPKPMRAIRFAPGGALPHPFDFAERDLVRREGGDGYLYPHDQLDGSSSDTIMSYAADVAALMCLGTASHMADPGKHLDKCYQVFRNWNLDRRRVNEWKMLVAGGALSEKRGHPASYDDAMPQGRHAPPDPAGWIAPIGNPEAPHNGSAAAAAMGEATARDQGWAQLLRRWLEVERQPDQDLLSATSLFPDWPSNHALSRGLAYLLDMPDPR
jgi:hypothetical protein